jgi:hypothetical protein
MEFIVNENYDDETGRCEKYNKIQPTMINLSRFNISNPQGLYGKLYNPDLIVIPDYEYKIIVSFPLNNPTEIKIKSTTPTTLRELLGLIQQVYIDVYKCEEETADETEFEIKKSCDCTEIDLVDKIKIDDTLSEDTECSICYMPLENQVSELRCNHKYHYNCILSWVNTGRGVNCPLCRSNIEDCSDCDNTKIITTTERFVVQPLEYRFPSFLRNSTNGVFGIHSYDLESLCIQSIWYNRLHKVVQMNILLDTVS